MVEQWADTRYSCRFRPDGPDHASFGPDAARISDAITRGRGAVHLSERQRPAAGSNGGRCGAAWMANKVFLHNRLHCVVVLWEGGGVQGRTVPDQPRARPSVSLQNGLDNEVGIYRTLRFWIPFPDRYIDLPTLYLYIGILSFITNRFLRCVVAAPLPFAPSLTDCDWPCPDHTNCSPQHSTQPAPRPRPCLTWVSLDPSLRPSVNDSPACKPRPFFLMHQCTPIDSKLLAHSAADNATQRKLGRAEVAQPTHYLLEIPKDVMRWQWARLLGQSGPAGLAQEGLYARHGFLVGSVSCLSPLVLLVFLVCD